MNIRIIDQGDPRWASLPYPRNPWTVKSDGCGLCAVTMCAMELEKYKNYTPKDTIGFMRQYATNGNGTEWLGIDKGLEKYMGNYQRHYTMSSFWAALDGGCKIGVILFGSGTAPDGTVWTRGGHYVCFVDYKKENGQHWLYTKDSSYRHNDGWHSYERSMKGCIPDVLWTAKKLKEGWYKEGCSWYYFKNGVMVKNDWVLDKNKWYYLGNDGKMFANAWCKWKGYWYYLKSSGAMASSEWVNDGKGWCYCGADGKMYSSRWLHWKNNFYYLKADGYMQTGSADIPCKFAADGRLEA